MKLSQFKIIGEKAKLHFINSEVEVVQEESLNGDIKFYDLNLSQIQDVKEKVFTNAENLSESEILYALLPYLCDIECDVPPQEFDEIMLTPTREFLEVLSVLFKMVKHILETIKSTSRTNIIAQEVMSNISEIKSTIKEETKKIDVYASCNIDELFELLGETKDKEDRKSIMKHIIEKQKEE